MSQYKRTCSGFNNIDTYKVNISVVEKSLLLCKTLSLKYKFTFSNKMNDLGLISRETGPNRNKRRKKRVKTNILYNFTIFE